MINVGKIYRESSDITAIILAINYERLFVSQPLILLIKK